MSYCTKGSFLPQNCPSGKYQNRTNQANCIMCEIGKECVSPGTSIPKNCSPGYICLIDQNNSYQRNFCDKGFYCLEGTPTLNV